jgi:hypothetical protein
MNETELDLDAIQKRTEYPERDAENNEWIEVSLDEARALLSLARLGARAEELEAAVENAISLLAWMEKKWRYSVEAGDVDSDCQSIVNDISQALLSVRQAAALAAPETKP